MVDSFIRCKRCGSPVKPKGKVGRPPKYCFVCRKRLLNERTFISEEKRRENRKKYLFKINELIGYQKGREIDYCVTPFGVYESYGSRETEKYSLDDRERKMLEGSKDENWRKKE